MSSEVTTIPQTPVKASPAQYNSLKKTSTSPPKPHKRGNKRAYTVQPSDPIRLNRPVTYAPVFSSMQKRNEFRRRKSILDLFSRLPPFPSLTEAQLVQKAAEGVQIPILLDCSLELS